MLKLCYWVVAVPSPSCTTLLLLVRAEVDQMTEVIRKRKRSTEWIEYGEALSVIQKCVLGSALHFP